jgi:Nucleoside 2-deoxyribosyltransferase like
MNCVGLFGTCGGSKWRDAVKDWLLLAGVDYFDPVVPNWTPECAAVEAEHLANDKVLIVAITGETESYGSLAETGWAMLSAHRNNQTAILVVEDCPGDPMSVPNRARKLVRAHAVKAGVRIYDSIDLATEAAILAIYAGD